MLTAQSGAVGPGVQITLDNGPATIEDSLVTEQDLQILVNGLWYAGAEAVSINGNRLSSLSAIGRSGQALTVNYRSLTRPYTVIALGNARQLADRIGSNTGGRYWAGRVENAELGFELEEDDDLRVPAAPVRRVELNHAEMFEGDS